MTEAKSGAALTAFLQDRCYFTTARALKTTQCKKRQYPPRVRQILSFLYCLFLLCKSIAKIQDVPFSRPFGATEKDAQKLHALWLLPMIVVRNTAHEVLCSASKTYLALILLLLAFGRDPLRWARVRVTADSAGWCFIALVQKRSSRSQRGLLSCGRGIRQTSFARGCR